MSAKYIVCDTLKCVGCGLCELACSASKEKTFNTLYSRIHTAHLAVMNEPWSSISMACYHCEDPICVRVCPREALSKDEKTGAIGVNTDFEAKNSCHVPCGWCQTACEFGAMILNPKLSAAAVCDLCPEDRIDGEPPCVRYCPKDALSLSTLEEAIEKTEDVSAKKVLREFAQARKNSKSFYERLGYIPMPPSRGKLPEGR